MASREFKTFLSKTDPTLETELRVKTNNYESNVSHTGNKFAPVLRMLDSASTALVGMQGYSLQNGEEGVELYTRREVNGSWVYNALRIGIDANGNQKIYATNPTAWDNIGSI